MPVNDNFRNAAACTGDDRHAAGLCLKQGHAEAHDRPDTEIGSSEVRRNRGRIKRPPRYGTRSPSRASVCSTSVPRRAVTDTSSVPRQIK